MRKHLLLPILLLLPFLASAQLPVGLAAGLLVNGTQAGAKAIRNRAGKPGEFVTYFRVGADSVAMKRTPENKVRGDAASSIRGAEQVLQRSHEAYRHPEVDVICPDAQTISYHIQQIRSLQPKWDVAPYEQELAFYQREQQRRTAATRVREQQARDAAERRWRARRDSVARVERRRDSLFTVAYARQQAALDSTAAVARRAAQVASPYRYVNAASLILRSQPSTTASSNTKIDGASCVQVLEHRPDGWDKIQVFDHVGYVKSEYLVPSRDEVTAPGVDWTYVRDAGPTYALTSTVIDEPAVQRPTTSTRKPTTTTTRRPAAARPAPRPAGGGVVYMCNSGNVVKYHASPGCRGLNRCSAPIVRISKAEAQQSMDACKFCY